MEIPKTMVVELVRSRSGAQLAERADKELPEKIDTDSDAELLAKYGVDPDDLQQKFRGQSPEAG